MAAVAARALEFLATAKARDENPRRQGSPPRPQARFSPSSARPPLRDIQEILALDRLVESLFAHSLHLSQCNFRGDTHCVGKLENILWRAGQAKFDLHAVAAHGTRKGV